MNSDLEIKSVTMPLLQLIKKLMASREGILGFVIVAFFMVLAVFSPYISPSDPFAQDFKPLQPPSIWHPFGTDPLGRDVLSRVIYGARVAMIFAFGASGLSLIIGVILGTFAGYFGGILDDVLSRVFEMVFMLPTFFLIILAVAIYGSNLINTMAIVALTMWPSNARIARAQVLTLKTRLYVQAATVTGAGTFRLLFNHILPNGLHPVIVNTAFQMAASVLLETAISFLGLGDPNAVSWGRILWDAQRNFSSWWLIVPGAAITVLSLGFSLLADGINYAFNPRHQSEKY